MGQSKYSSEIIIIIIIIAQKNPGHLAVESNFAGRRDRYL